MIDAEACFGFVILVLAIYLGWRLAQGQPVGRSGALPRPPEHVNGAPMTNLSMGVASNGDRYFQVSYDPMYRQSPEELAAYAAEAARQEMYRRGQHTPSLDGLGIVIDLGAAQQQRRPLDYQPINPQPYDGRY